MTKHLVEIFAKTKKDLRNLEDLNLDIKTRTANKEDEINTQLQEFFLQKKLRK
ncbi:MAG TPA: hypothetical protein VH500_00285 [Nitrososphaeraceae archaeon]